MLSKELRGFGALHHVRLIQDQALLAKVEHCLDRVFNNFKRQEDCFKRRSEALYNALEQRLFQTASGRLYRRCLACGAPEPLITASIHKSFSTEPDCFSNRQRICARCRGKYGSRGVDFRPPWFRHVMAERYQRLQSLRREVARRQEKLVWVALRAAEQGVTAAAFLDWPEPGLLAIPGGVVLDFEPSVLDHYRPIIDAAPSKVPGPAQAVPAEPQRPPTRPQATGLDPETLQHVGLTLTSWCLEDGPRSFAGYGRVMIEDLGEIARPYLKSWYLAMRFDPRFADLSGFSPASEVEAAEVQHLGQRQAKTRPRSAASQKASRPRPPRPPTAGGSRRPTTAAPAAG
jgi:hypothetical protein